MYLSSLSPFVVDLSVSLTYFICGHVDDAVFRRKIAESVSTEERNRASENKRGRWDQPDAQINNSEDHWERIVERTRNQRGLVPLFYKYSL